MSVDGNGTQISIVREVGVAEKGSAYAATNHYVVEEVIARGGMGTVYRARDVQLKRDVALKVLNSDDPDFLERFLREREVTADLDHPGFVRILASGYIAMPEGSRPFYTMPLIRGQTLEHLVTERAKPGPAGERLRIEHTLARMLHVLQRICLTLQSAHDKNIIHRDVKPANIIVGPYGEVYVTDLGLAKRIQDSRDTRFYEARVRERYQQGQEEQDLTRGVALGTPYYMAPEQILTPREIDHRADIFGLGGILYYILTGLRPQYENPIKDRRELEQRRSRLLERLRAFTDPFGGLMGLLMTPRKELPAEALPFVQQYDEVDGILNASDYYLFRLTMQECSIVPPSEILERQRESFVYCGTSVEHALEAVCMKALAKRPQDRYESARAMWREIQQYVEHRRDMILHREAKEMVQTPSKRGLQTALEDYEQAERKLQEAIADREKAGQFAIEEKMALFDVLVGKSKIYDQRWDGESILSMLSRAEPMIESTLAVVQRQFVQLLLAKTTALVRQKRYDEAKEIAREALVRSRSAEEKQLRALAFHLYGTACALDFALKSEEGVCAEAREAFAESQRLADEMRDGVRSVQARVSLAQTLLRADEPMGEVKRLLDEALPLAGQDVAALASIRAQLGAWCLRRGDVAGALREGQSAVALAEESGAETSLHEAHWVLAQARHLSGDFEGRIRHVREALPCRHPREPSMKEEVAAFYSRNDLDLRELL